VSWRGSDITIVVEDYGTDDPVVTVTIKTPAGVVLAMAEVNRTGRTLELDGFHMHGETVGPNTLGVGNLGRLAQAVMETIDVDEIVIRGAIRTTGANPGRRPRERRYKRAREP
jgi:hypothetical protein